jgi:hypothetical protein
MVNGSVPFERQWMLLSFVIATKESNQRKNLVKTNASTLSADSYAFVDAPHHSKS